MNGGGRRRGSREGGVLGGSAGAGGRRVWVWGGETADLGPPRCFGHYVSSGACGHGTLGQVEEGLGGVLGRGLTPVSSAVNTIS